MDRRQAIAGLMGGTAACMGHHGVRVGSKNFSEQVILGEIIAQHLERRGKAVRRRLNLGGTLLAHQSLIVGQIDVYPEYSGTALTAILKQPPSGDAATVRQMIRARYEKLGLAWLDPLGIDNGFAMVVAARHSFRTLSEAATASEPWVLGVGYEFEQRADGLPALNKAYSLPWKGRPKTMDLGLLYKALEQQQVTMIAANATDGLLSKLELKVLADDRHAFPPYEISIAARQETLRNTAGLREALDELAGKFTNAIMQQLNFEVDGEHRSVADVAAGFLKR